MNDAATAPGTRGMIPIRQYRRENIFLTIFFGNKKNVKYLYI